MKIILSVRIPPYLDQMEPDSDIPSIQFHSYWKRAIESLGHTVKVFRYTDSVFIPNKLKVAIEANWERYCSYTFHKWRLFLNRFYRYNPENWVRSNNLKRLIQVEKPQAIVFSKGISELLAFPIADARRKKISLYLLSGENPTIAATSFEKDNAKLFDWIIINDPAHKKLWQNLGARNVLPLPYAAIDPTIHRKKKLSASLKKKYQSSVVFVGSLSTSRQKLFVNLLENNIPLKLWGYIPSTTKLNAKLKDIYHGEAWGETVVNIYNAAKIVLNPVLASMPTGGNLRTFEIPGCGAFELTNRCDKNWFIPGKEIALYGSVAELVEIIHFYLKNDHKRNSIASSGYKRTQKDHTYKNRFRTILKLK